MSIPWNRKRNEKLREEILSARFPSGLGVHFLPKPGFQRKTCILAIRYGSLDGAFIPPGAKIGLVAPPGLAHFLEHRAFTSDKGDAFLRFASLGASSNAATSLNSTTYYFSCVDNFQDALAILLEFLDGLHITEEMVEKERRIIAEEIRGYRDDPGGVAFQRLMTCMYLKSFARFDIGGTLESIQAIDRDLLKTASRAFYRPGNADLFISGDLDPEALMAWIARDQDRRPLEPPVKRIEEIEPEEVAYRVSRTAMVVSRPKVLIGFKEKDPLCSGTPLLLRQFETSIALSATFGRASDFFRRTYEEGLIDENFHAYYNAEPRIGFTLFSTDTDEPEAFIRRIFERLDAARLRGVDVEDFRRILTRIRGRYLRNFNHPETAAFVLMHNALLKTDLFDVPEILDRVTLEGVNRRLAEHLDPASHAVSIVLPAARPGSVAGRP